MTSENPELPHKADWPPKDAGARQAAIDRKLAELRERHPQWDVHGTFGGWLAVPHGTPVMESIDLDGIDAKITAHESGGDVTDGNSFQVTETAAGKVPAHPHRRRHPVTTTKASDAALKAALKAAGGNASRLSVQPDGSIIIANNGRGNQ